MKKFTVIAGFAAALSACAIRQAVDELPLIGIWASGTMAQNYYEEYYLSDRTYCAFRQYWRDRKILLARTEGSWQRDSTLGLTVSYWKTDDPEIDQPLDYAESRVIARLSSTVLHWGFQSTHAGIIGVSELKRRDLNRFQCPGHAGRSNGVQS